MTQGTVIAIHISDKGGEPMRSVPQVQAVPGQGLEGDRYYDKTGTYSDRGGDGRDVTLVEAEQIEAFARESGVQLGPGDTRRNITTRGIALNDLVDREFRVGEATLRGVRLCEPCSYLQSLTHEKVLSGLVHRAGLRCDIVQGGAIREGDAVQAL